jgi:ketosteroid isomerase-like protein
METESVILSCTRLAHRFCLLADVPDSTAAAALFAEDGVFERGQARAVGRAAIEQMFQARPPQMLTRHAITTSLIDVESPDTASARHYCLVHVSMPEAGLSQPIVRDYQDRYRLTSEGWKIASRVVTTPFEDQLSR